MTQRQQRVEGVLAVNRVVGPGAEEAAAIGPERVHEIEARIAQARDRHVQRGQGVERGCRGEKIRNGRGARGEKPAARVTAIEQPQSRCPIEEQRPDDAAPGRPPPSPS